MDFDHFLIKSTVVMGDSGVGFAPMCPGAGRTFIELRQGAEDIPGAAAHEGIPSDSRENFPEYLDILSRRVFDIDGRAPIPCARMPLHPHPAGSKRSCEFR